MTHHEVYKANYPVLRKCHLALDVVFEKHAEALSELVQQAPTVTNLRGKVRSAAFRSLERKYVAIVVTLCDVDQ